MNEIDADWLSMACFGRNFDSVSERIQKSHRLQKFGFEESQG